jgi:hypothetical protein
MTGTDWDYGDDGTPWFSPFARPCWAYVAIAATLPISGLLWVMAFMIGTVFLAIDLLKK